MDNPEEVHMQEVAVGMADINDFLRAHMQYAQAKYIDNGDVHRLAAPVFQQNDMVFLDIHNMHTIHPMRKLDDRNAGPFCVICVLGPCAYELELHAEMQLRTRVFHTALLDVTACHSIMTKYRPWVTDRHSLTKHL